MADSDASARALFIDLLRRFRVQPDGDTLVVQPAEDLTDEDVVIIRAMKPQLLRLLKRHKGDVSPTPRRPTKPSDLPSSCVARQVCTVLGPCGGCGENGPRPLARPHQPTEPMIPTGIASQENLHRG